MVQFKYDARFALQKLSLLKLLPIFANFRRLSKENYFNTAEENKQNFWERINVGLQTPLMYVARGELCLFYLGFFLLCY
jgi:hypothetical protein